MEVFFYYFRSLHKPAGAPSGSRSIGALDALAKGSALAAVSVWVGASFG